MATVPLPSGFEEPAPCRIVPIGREHLAGFHAALDRVAREGRYLAMLQAPPFARTRRFVLESLRDGAIHFVALMSVAGPQKLNSGNVPSFVWSSSRSVSGVL